MISALLFTGYALLAGWLITRLRFFKNSGIAARWLLVLFGLKLAVAAAYGYIHTLPDYYPDKIDTWRWYFESLNETRLLKANPAEFFRSLFYDPYHGSTGNILGTENSFWNDLKNNFMIKLMALMNLLSGGRYYVNLIFYSFLAFYGPVAIYRLFTAACPTKKAVVFTAAFLLPSVLFWGSGFHKEGLLLSLIGLTVWWFFKGLQHRFSFTLVAGIGLGLVLIFVLRNYILFALLPALACWWLAAHRPGRTAAIFAAGFALFVLVFFTAGHLHPALNLPARVSQKQAEFMELGGATFVGADTLRPGAAGFLHNLPAAADMAFLRPHPGEGGLSYLPATAEVAGLLLLIILWLLAREKMPRQRPLLWFCGAFAITLLLIIGYSVPITGAVIRYRSLALPFLFLLFALPVNLERVLRKFGLKNYKKK